uniref:SPX domain-containing protein n=1 Tax=Physcomitrium patens TaxID=3218 RepID=A0A2K1KF26_PHYPA|nr:hypothetical protein PHYPA_008754 [Physcomitrium patens]
MVGFGKKLQKARVPTWEVYYISYKMMKEKVNVFGQELKSGSKVERKRILKEFKKF